MCSLVFLFRPGQDWPLLLAGNRDERRERAWRAPGRHWPDRPEVVAGLDRHAQGSWFGLNDHGVVAVVMNREGTLGPAPGKRSRGELVLEALDHAQAEAAAAALADIDPRAYRPFNLFIADALSVRWLRHRGANGEDAGIEVFDVAAGLHMLAAGELDDGQSARVRDYLPRFETASTPRPESNDWRDWTALLASREHSAGGGPEAAMNVDRPDGFGTVCAHLLALPRYPRIERRPIFLFAAGPPDRVPFEAVAID